MQKTQQQPRAGLELHCAECGLMVPSDAPRSGAFDCAHIAKNKLANFNPRETPAGQHVMAVAAWAMIYDAALRAKDAAAVPYQNSFRASRKKHFEASAVRKGMTADEVKAGQSHPRDRSLYS